ncbi:Protein of unknown function DUF4953 [Phytophthora cactorum]|nr:Protein of unknown function DUF4953 [Phytophthora cactorum]
MAKVVDSPRFRLESESDDEIDIELGTPRDTPVSENSDGQTSEHDTAALLVTDRRKNKQGYWRWHLGSLRKSRNYRGEEVQNGDVAPFLDVQFYPGERALFVLSKQHWNASFIVYPTVVKRAAPVIVGAERGGILLETNDFVFHFELSADGRHLQLVQEYHYATLHGDKADEIQQIFDDSQWPAYITKVPIYAETDDAYYIPSDLFLSSGFFVSSVLASPDFTALEDPSESFARNTMLFVEYELASGVIEVNYAIGLLPDQIMPQRVADDRVGYFAKRYTQYSLTDQELSDGNGYHRWDPQMTVIHRRKLELDSTGKATKHPSRMERSLCYWCGGLDPAFERIGFPNAIRAVLPSDSDWPGDYRLGDLRYNSISVMISQQTYAYGPTVIDPRSGEILHSDIVFEYGFFNAVMVDFDMKSPVDPPKARKSEHGDAESSNLRKTNKKFSHARTGRSRSCGLAHEEQHTLDRMMLSSIAGDDNGFVPKRLIAQHFADIVMHEVGHTLGLRHNFAGSSAYSRDQLRDPVFVAEHGISTTIMDYLPVNIFSDLTKDEVGNHGFFMSTIGAYDYAAIAYGYSVVDDEIPGYKHSRLSELAATTPLFLTDESAGNMLNPYAQLFDLSSDPVDYAADRLKFVQNARSPNAALDKVPEDASWTTLWERESVQLRLLEHAINIVRPILGGVNITHAHRDKDGGVYNATFVPKEIQIKALKVLLRIVQAEKGLFPEPKDYGSFMEVVGFDDEDCNEATLDYACLGRGLVDVGAYVLRVRGRALISALFPAMERMVQQDALSPLTLNELLTEVVQATNSAPYSFTLKEFLNELLLDTLSSYDTDSRVKRAIEENRAPLRPTALALRSCSSHAVGSDTSKSTVRVRYAPSPTGYLHLGGLRTALFNYLFAKSSGGQFILRIEDTDKVLQTAVLSIPIAAEFQRSLSGYCVQTRQVEGSVEALVNSLKWCGVEEDEGPNAGGPHGPYIQSQRLPIYKEAAEKLIESGHAYRCFCSSERLQKLRESQTRHGEATMYDRACLGLDEKEVEARVACGEPHTIRLKIPEGKTVVKDLLRGYVQFEHAGIDDQVLMKSDGYPTYHLANVVDDHAMHISHVIRGEEWLPSTPKHVILYKALGYEAPTWAHLGLLLNEDRSKLSKRQGDVAVEDFRDKGFIPSGLVNFVALLGWNPAGGNNQEIFQMKELEKHFSIDHVNKAGSVVNVDRLRWINSRHVRRCLPRKMQLMSTS